MFLYLLNNVPSFYISLIQFQFIYSHFYEFLYILQKYLYEKASSLQCNEKLIPTLGTDNKMQFIHHRIFLRSQTDSRKKEWTLLQFWKRGQKYNSCSYRHTLISLLSIQIEQSILFRWRELHIIRYYITHSRWHKLFTIFINNSGNNMKFLIKRVFPSYAAKECKTGNVERHKFFVTPSNLDPGHSTNSDTNVPLQ